MLDKLYAVFKAGGFTLVAMLACSIIAVAVAIERAIHLWSFQERARDLADAVKRCLYRGAIAEARTACERSRSGLAEVFLIGFERLRRSSPQALGAAVDRERQRLTLGLRGPLWVLGTIGATTPFLGLFGTVVGIMGAFRRIGENKQTGIEVVGPYISEALIATAVGIGVAVVALMLFNFFQARLGRINIELRLLVEEFVEILTDSTVIPSKDSPEPSQDDDEPESDRDGERASVPVRKKERG
jgi:biopolymer transport protein ExbB